MILRCTKQPKNFLHFSSFSVLNQFKILKKFNLRFIYLSNIGSYKINIFKIISSETESVPIKLVTFFVIFLCLSVHVSVCVSVFLSVCLAVCSYLSLCPHPSLSIYFYLCNYLHVSLSAFILLNCPSFRFSFLKQRNFADFLIFSYIFVYPSLQNLINLCTRYIPFFITNNIVEIL